MNEKPSGSAVHAWRQANRAAKAGDFAAAERWRKHAESMAQIAERQAALPAPVSEEEGAEERRAELRRRIARFCEAAVEVQNWEAEQAEYEAQCAAALANGVEPPPAPRAHPGGALGDDYLEAIAKGEA